MFTVNFCERNIAELNSIFNGIMSDISSTESGIQYFKTQEYIDRSKVAQNNTERSKLLLSVFDKLEYYQFREASILYIYDFLVPDVERHDGLGQTKFVEAIESVIPKDRLKEKDDRTWIILFETTIVYDEVESHYQLYVQKDLISNRIAVWSDFLTRQHFVDLRPWINLAGDRSVWLYVRNDIGKALYSYYQHLPVSSMG